MNFALRSGFSGGRSQKWMILPRLVRMKRISLRQQGHVGFDRHHFTMQSRQNLCSHSRMPYSPTQSLRQIAHLSDIGQETADNFFIRRVIRGVMVKSVLLEDMRTLVLLASVAAFLDCTYASQAYSTSSGAVSFLHLVIGILISLYKRLVKIHSILLTSYDNFLLKDRFEISSKSTASLISSATTVCQPLIPQIIINRRISSKQQTIDGEFPLALAASKLALSPKSNIYQLPKQKLQSIFDFFYYFTRMATHTALRPILDSLIRQLSPHPAQKVAQQITDDSQITTPILRRLHFAITQTKRTVLAQIQSLRDASSDEPVTAAEKHLLKILGSKLDVLDGNPNLLLKEGILSLYMQLCEAKAFAMKKGVCLSIRQLLDCAVESTISLLRVYFVYHESQQNQSKNKQNQLYQLKNISEEELSHMESKLSDKSIQILLQKETAKLEKEMKEGLEVCRICSLKIRFDEIEKHVKVCQRRGCLKQELLQKASQMALLLQELKQKPDKNDGLVRCKLDDDYRILVKLILSSERKRDRPIDRRCSLVTMPSEKSIHNKIEQCIQLYLQEHGEDPLLEKILSVIKAKANIQKTISSLDSAQLADPSPDKPSVYKTTVRNSKRLPTTPPPLPTRDNLSNSSIENTDGDTEKEQGEEINLGKSKKSLSKRTRQSQDAMLGTLRSYSSLQEIVVKAEAEDQPISLQSFQILKFLGQGAFGKVYLVRRKETKDIYALKIIRISESEGQKQLASIKNQHQIFKKIGGNHLVKAPFSFNERSSHIFVLQYLPGGDLRRMLDDEVYFEEERAQFYLAEIILAIEHLHKFNIIHRDLKPQNLVIDRSGHLKLTDFGLSQLQMNEKLKKSRTIQMERVDSAAKHRKRRTAVLSSRHKRRLIGTPDYIAPEIINGISLTNFTIDWWSLGVMAYELLIGTRPFCAESIDEVIDNITNFKLEWPEVGRQEGMISPEAKDLIEKLLNKDFTSRLGSKGADQIKNHVFFQGVDWQNIKTSKPAFLPKLANLNEYSQAPQDPALLQEIHELTGDSSKSKPQLKLERFVRFDLLGSETIESVQKVHQQQKLRLKRLKTLQQISNDDRQRPDDL